LGPEAPGDAQENAIAETILKNLKSKITNFVGKTNLSELVALIGQAKLLITNDGGPLHIAVALKTKTVSIFGPVDSSVYGPFPASQQHIVVDANLACRPCYQNFRLPNCEHDRLCINTISVEKVYSVVRSLVG